MTRWIPELTGDPTPPRRRPLSTFEQSTLRQQTTEWYTKGIVEKTPTPLPWTNNTVFAAKANGSLRTCIDCTPVNRVTKDFDWPLPRLQDLRNFLVGQRIYSRIDLRDAFFRVHVPEEHRRWTAFTCDGQDYQFVRMPFGLKTAPSTFQRLMDHALAEVKEFVFCYMDDILIRATSPDQARTRLNRVKEVLARHNMTVNEDKSEYLTHELQFAGMWIGPEGLGPNRKQVDKILALPPPRTRAEAQSVLGLASYLRDFVPLASRYSSVLSGSGRIDPATYERGWDELRTHLSQTITSLAMWDEQAPADLFTDASNLACSAVLIQKGKIVALASRKFGPAETRYSTTDREHLGLMLAVNKFKIFLHRKSPETRIHSDHSSLLNRRLYELTPRQCRWRTLVEAWIPNLHFVRGKENPADYFSRWGLNIFGGQVEV